jgi:4-hydroxy-3-polyprenylbenzoate decarboxylase
MAYDHLQDFLEALEKAGEMRHIDTPVSTQVEISRWTDRESKSPGGGKALYFSNVVGSRFPVVTNIFGSTRRICLALEVGDLDELGSRVRQYLEFNPPKTLRDAIQVLPLAINAARFIPRSFSGRTPACQEVVHTGDTVDLSMLPVLQCWPKDAGPFVTLPLVITRSLVTGKRNVGMYRLQIFDRNTTGMHWHVHKDGSHYYHEYEAAGRRMPVAVAIGADPATTYSATAPLPRGVDEMLLSGFIRKKSVRMAKCVTVDLEVPAEAEFVLEGYVDPGERRVEGPFGDHTGYYSLADLYPVFHVTAVTHRKNAVYSATLVGRPPMEDCYLAKATERLFLPMLQTVMPEVKDYWLPWEGVFHNIVVVAIEKEYPGHAHKVMNGLWGQGQMSFAKSIIVVDRDVNIQDPSTVLECLINRFDPGSDQLLSKGILDVLDHSSPVANFGAKIGLDLTRRIPGEPPREARPNKGPVPLDGNQSRQTLQKELKTFLEDKGQWGIDIRPLMENIKTGEGSNRFCALRVQKDGDRGGRMMAETLFEAEFLSSYNILLLYDQDIDIEDGSLILWKLFNNVDPSRDIFEKGHRFIIDACKKLPIDGHTREWPEDLTFDPKP